MKIITMIGSSRFRKDHEREARRLTIQGFLVIPLIFYSDTKKEYEIVKKNIDTLNRICNNKIELCDIVFVVNPNGYIGKRTQQTIEIAKSLGKEIWYMESSVSEQEGDNDNQ